MRRIILVLISIALGILNIQPSFAQNNKITNFEWPEVPYIPKLVYISESSEAVCASYEYEARREFLKGFITIENSSNEFTMVEPVSFKAESYNDLFIVFNGDINGKGLNDFFIAIRRPWKANVSHKLVPIQKNDAINYQNLMSTFTNSYDRRQKQAIRKLQEEILQKLNVSLYEKSPDALDKLPNRKFENLAREAYGLLDIDLKYMNYDGRIFVDALVGLQKYRVLLSFDGEMRPKAECIVEVRNDEDAIMPFSKLDKLNYLMNLTSKMVGKQSRCKMGGSIGSPFARLNKWRKDTINEALNRPWHGVDRVRKGEMGKGAWNYNANTKMIDSEIHLVIPEYQYFWSLQNPFNRNIYAQLEKSYDHGIDRLSKHYQDSFGVDYETAELWAKLYFHILRYNSSVYGSYYASPESVEKIKSKTATISNYISIAERGYYLKNEDDINDRALSIAVGAKATRTVMQELIDRGANINITEEPPLMNSVDNLEAMTFLLDNGADVDQRNSFGKTALMMAAHMNNIEAIKLLLRSQADPNLKTWGDIPKIQTYSGNMIDDCRYVLLKFRERTALMYAAENASFEVLKTLFEAGARINAIDSEGRDIGQYLNLNSIMTEEELVFARKILKAK